ncbi:MAG: restriction endonuclease subunit S [Cyanobacteria bacterium]|nr:restriction endonuclease subunit S [Cyanobacteriota bacterium]
MIIKRRPQKFVPLANLRIFPIPLPPLNEQKRIVAKIEELRSHTQAARNAIVFLERIRNDGLVS